MKTLSCNIFHCEVCGQVDYIVSLEGVPVCCGQPMYLAVRRCMSQDKNASGISERHSTEKPGRCEVTDGCWTLECD
jgi:hypothetical protein